MAVQPGQHRMGPDGSPAGPDAVRLMDSRAAPVSDLADQAGEVAAACHAMAARFHAGGKLMVFGTGGASTDAQHVAVEFVHPVIVGKRALPAVALTADVATVTGLAERDGMAVIFAHQIRCLAAPGDIALGISPDGNCRSVVGGLAAAADLGLLRIALVGGDGGDIAASRLADHLLVAQSRDPRIVKEVHVTAYHVLWELVHVFFEQPGLLWPAGAGMSGPPGSPGPAGLEALYPFLYSGNSDLPAVLTQVRASTVAKVDEITELRRLVAERDAERLAAAAGEVAARFAAGGRLLAFGNGGSATDAQQLATLFLNPGPGTRPLPAFALANDTSVVTALCNDIGVQVLFARQIAAMGTSCDIAVGLSTSGNSENLVRGFEEAGRRGMLTIGLAGYQGGKMAELDSIDHLFVVPSSSVHRIQEAQTTVYQVLWELTVAALGELDPR